MPTKEELVHEQNEARFKRALDNLSVRRYYERCVKQALSNGLTQKFVQGFAQGFVQGFEEGYEQGRTEVRMAALVDLIRVLQQILKIPLTPEVKLRPLSEAELRHLSTNLKRQALSR